MLGSSVGKGGTDAGFAGVRGRVKVGKGAGEAGRVVETVSTRVAIVLAGEGSRVWELTVGAGSEATVIREVELRGSARRTG